MYSLTSVIKKFLTVRIGKIFKVLPDSDRINNKVNETGSGTAPKPDEHPADIDITGGEPSQPDDNGPAKPATPTPKEPSDNEDSGNSPKEKTEPVLPEPVPQPPKPDPPQPIPDPNNGTSPKGPMGPADPNTNSFPDAPKPAPEQVIERYKGPSLPLSKAEWNKCEYYIS